MKLPCGACGKYIAGPSYSPGMGCFFCWSAKCSTQYRDYWEDGDKVVSVLEPPAAPALAHWLKDSTRSFEPTGSPYKQDHVFKFSPSVPSAPQIAPPPLRTVSGRCIHRGEESGTIRCPTCRGHVEVKSFDCGIYGKCTLAKKLEDVACCVGCPSFKGE